jgi:hypothetical protein
MEKGNTVSGFGNENIAEYHYYGSSMNYKRKPQNPIRVWGLLITWRFTISFV